MNIEVWLGAHPEQNKTLEKARKLKEGAQPNPFIDPQGWKNFLEMMIARGTGRGKPDGVPKAQ